MFESSSSVVDRPKQRMFSSVAASSSSSFQSLVVSQALSNSISNADSCWGEVSIWGAEEDGGGRESADDNRGSMDCEEVI